MLLGLKCQPGRQQEASYQLKLRQERRSPEEVKPRRNCLKTGFQYEKEVEHEVKSKNEEASTRKKKKLKEIKNEPLKTSKETGFKEEKPQINSKEV